MAPRAMPAARTRSAFASRCAAAADERERGRWPKLVELIEWSDAQESCLAALQERSCLTR